MKFFASLLLVLLFVSARADEGMWLLSMLGKKHADMKAAGLKLSAEDIYSINHASLKDAIIQFGNGCTGEVISSKGLVLTNHHCGYGQIQYHSSVDHNYLQDGFWAMDIKDELPNQGLTAKFLVRIEDVTTKSLDGVNENMSETEREKLIRENSLKIEKEAAVDGLTAMVRSYFGGNNYYLLVYEVYSDVRLVGAPPSSIGKFGGDTDNWMWPRHTCDFSMFRIYMSPDGKPANYSADNIPYVPKHYLPVSIKGVEEKDFTMILGYPGRTSRYMSSYDVQEAIDLLNPSIVKIRDKKLNILRERMNSSTEIRIKYAAKYAATSNYWKYFIGQTRGLKRLNVVAKKQKQEQEFDKWAKADPARNAKYGNVIQNLERYQKELTQFKLMRNYVNEAAMRGPDLIGFANRFSSLLKALEENNSEKVKSLCPKLIEQTLDFYKDFDLETEKLLYKNLLELFYNDVNKEYFPTIMIDIAKKYKGDFDKYTRDVFTNTMFISSSSVLSFLESPTFKKIESDPIIKAMNSLRGVASKYNTIYNEQQQLLEKNYRLYMAGIVEMNTDKLYYPDANSTMRLTYGQVLPYTPADAVEYEAFTTLDGVMQKEDPDSYEFQVPARLKELWKNKDFGQYGSNGTLNTCFLHNTDITGGNSGSPVLNGKGELVGLAFDGNWEAMSGDIAFEPELQRTISVDIRYVMFIIDKFAGCKRLIDEMTIIQ